MVLVCRVTSHDQMIKGYCDFMCRGPSRYVTILQSLVAINIVVVML